MPLGNSRASSHGLPRGDVWNKIRTRIYIRNRVGLSSSSTSNICSCSPNFKPSYLFRLLRSWWHFSRRCFLFLGLVLFWLLCWRWCFRLFMRISHRRRLRTAPLSPGSLLLDHSSRSQLLLDRGIEQHQSSVDDLKIVAHQSIITPKLLHDLICFRFLLIFYLSCFH